MPEIIDLAVLVADKDIEQTIRGVLEAHALIGIRRINI
jgi:hypothetical protein